MRRDMNVLRQIMMAVRDGSGPVNGVEMPVQVEHFNMCVEARLIHPTNDPDVADRLTWQGYEFVSLAASDAAWAGMNAQLAAAGFTDAPFDFVVDLLRANMMERVGLRAMGEGA